MKKIFYLIIAFLLTVSSFAQTPKCFNYQAVIRDASGGILANKEVVVQLDIVQGSTNGTTVYTEQWDIQTNQLGLINLEIGAGNPANFELIDWSDGSFFIALTIDGELLGTSPILSVPFATQSSRAAFANKAQTVTEKQDISINGNEISISGGSTISLPEVAGQSLSLTGNELSISGGNFITLPAAPAQTLTISGQQLSISDGNSIIIPDNYQDADADPTNEIELPAQAVGDANKTLVADGAGNVIWQAGTVDTKLSEADVDAFVSNNGFQLSADDGDVDDTNEIQDLNLTGDVLKITRSGTATNINLEAYKDNTDDQTLTEILTASTSAGNKTISDLLDPTSAQEAATKKYVDNQYADKVDVAVGKVLSSNDYTDAEKAQLAVAEMQANKNVANGYPGLDASLKIDKAQLPAITINNVFTVIDETAMLALTVVNGDVAIRTDISKNLIFTGSGANVLGDWIELANPSVQVTTVNGKTGDVVLSVTDIATLQTLLDAKLTSNDIAAVATSGSYADLSGTPVNLDIDKTDDLLKTDLVNNLVDGGTNKALTAEQGKLLKSSLDSKLSALDVYSRTEADNLLNAKVNIVSGKSLSSNDYTTTEKTKLAGAEILANKNVVNGYAGLDASKKIDKAQLPAITLNNVYTITTQTAMLALSAANGDVAIRTDISKNFIYTGGGASILSNWIELATPAGQVSSVNGKDGNVVLGIADIATLQAALDAKALDADLATVAKTGDYSDLSGVPANIDTDAGNDLLKTDLVNDLLSGGTTKALTAEQGKNLKTTVDNISISVAAEETRATTAEGVNATAIASEITNRITDVNAEETRALAAESALGTDISNEESRATAAETANTAAINTEKVRVDAILSGSETDKDSFAEIESLIYSVVTETDNALAAEIIRATTAEGVNATAIASEITNRITDVNAEETRALAAESVNATAIASHSGLTNNPHSVTKTQVGLSNVDNTSDATKNAATATLTNKIIDADLNAITNIENANIKTGAAIDAAKIANGSVSNTEFQYLDGVTSNVQTQLTNNATNISTNTTAINSLNTTVTTNANAINTKLTANSPITGATKTKITYDADGLVTAGADATTADIAASTNKNYVTDAMLTDLQNIATATSNLISTSTSYTVTTTDKYVICSAGVTITLPTANGVAGKEYIVKNMSSAIVTIKANGSQQILEDSATSGNTTTIGVEANNNWIKLVSDGSGWISFRALY